MKYPQQQFDLLVKGLTILNSHFEIANIHPCQLQYTLYQQASEGQRHNALFVNKDGKIVKGYYAKDLGLEGFVMLIGFLNEDNFPLYPDGCNDTHVETAVKIALKQIKNIAQSLDAVIQDYLSDSEQCTNKYFNLLK